MFVSSGALIALCFVAFYKRHNSVWTSGEWHFSLCIRTLTSHQISLRCSQGDQQGAARLALSSSVTMMNSYFMVWISTRSFLAVASLTSGEDSFLSDETLFIFHVPYKWCSTAWFKQRWGIVIRRRMQQKQRSQKYIFWRCFSFKYIIDYTAVETMLISFWQLQIVTIKTSQ